MPKLSYPRITKGDAVYYLLRLYWNEPEFVEELRQLHQPYAQPLIELAKAMVRFFVDCRQALSSEDYHKMTRDFYNQWVTKGGKDPELPPNLSRQLKRIKQMYPRLQSYFDGLEELAYRWKLRASWAGVTLYINDMADLLKAIGMPDNIDVPLEELELLHPYAPPVPALEIRVPAWALIHYTPGQIKAEITKKLKDYESRIRAACFKEYPSALDAHARWWFEHFVHGKEYDDIAQEEAYRPGGSLISYAKNVGNAVRKFSRLIGIEIKRLK